MDEVRKREESGMIPGFSGLWRWEEGKKPAFTKYLVQWF